MKIQMTHSQNELQEEIASICSQRNSLMQHFKSQQLDRFANGTATTLV